MELKLLSLLITQENLLKGRELHTKYIFIIDLRIVDCLFRCCVAFCCKLLFVVIYIAYIEQHLSLQQLYAILILCVHYNLDEHTINVQSMVVNNDLPKFI